MIGEQRGGDEQLNRGKRAKGNVLVLEQLPVHYVMMITLHGAFQCSYSVIIHASQCLKSLEVKAMGLA